MKIIVIRRKRGLAGNSRTVVNMAAIPAEKSAMARLADDAAQVKSKVADVNAAVEVR